VFEIKSSLNLKKHRLLVINIISDILCYWLVNHGLQPLTLMTFLQVGECVMKVEAHLLLVVKCKATCLPSLHCCPVGTWGCLYCSFRGSLHRCYQYFLRNSKECLCQTRTHCEVALLQMRMPGFQYVRLDVALQPPLFSQVLESIGSNCSLWGLSFSQEDREANETWGFWGLEKKRKFLPFLVYLFI